MKKILLFAFALLIVILPTKVGAVMQTLNGLGGQNQTFTNDTNVKVTSSGTTHTLGWNGVLSPLRGGLGVNASAFSTGAIPFFDGTNFAHNSSDFFWDDVNKSLSVSQIVGKINSPFSISSNGDGQNLSLFASSGVSGKAGDLFLSAGSGENNQPGGDVIISSGASNSFMPGNVYIHASSGNGVHLGGTVNIQGGDGSDGGKGATVSFEGSSGNAGGSINISGGLGYGNNGGLVVISGGYDSDAPGSNAGTIVIGGNGSNGTLEFYTPSNGNFLIHPNTELSGYTASLDFHSITSSSKTFTFPNTSGTVSILSGTSDQTLHIGNDGIPGCIAMGDSDANGVTYITANDGVLSASTTAPSNCN